MVGTKRAVAGENIAADAATNKRSDDALVATMIKSNILMLSPASSLVECSLSHNITRTEICWLYIRSGSESAY